VPTELSREYGEAEEDGDKTGSGRTSMAKPAATTAEPAIAHGDPPHLSPHHSPDACSVALFLRTVIVPNTSDGHQTASRYLCRLRQARLTSFSTSTATKTRDETRG